jgi:hypothetical protein
MTVGLFSPETNVRAVVVGTSLVFESLAFASPLAPTPPSVLDS